MNAAVDPAANEILAKARPRRWRWILILAGPLLIAAVVAWVILTGGRYEVTDRIGPMLAHPLMHIGASDGGAHIASFSTYVDTGYLFSEFVRKSGAMSLEAAVAKITSETADIWGLKGRGRLAAGQCADVVIFDADTIGRGEEHPVFDMPGDGMRYVRGATGIDTVLVNGQVAYAAGAYTDARSGVVCV